MSDNSTSRLSRLTAIVTLLQTKRILTATEISERFAVSIRTVYRDIRALEEAGVPVFTEEGKGYSLIEGYTLPPVMFSEEEANALITAGQMILKNKDASLVKNYTHAIHKIKAMLRYESKYKADLLSQRIVFRQNAEAERTSVYLSDLQVAITNFNVIRLRYHAAEKDEISSRLIEPFALYNTHENWVLIAWCRLRKDFRQFRLDRIISSELLQEHFQPHKLTLQEYFEICRASSMTPK